MDTNLLLSAQTLSLAANLKRSEQPDGLIVLKNLQARTYMTVTREQLLVLLRFEKPQMVPAVLGSAIEERQCLPLGEFYELILKALRAEILLEPGVKPETILANEWNWNVRPSVLKRPLAVLFVTGLVMAFSFQPKLPTSFFNALVGLGLLSAALSLGELLAACMIRGAGGEVYRPRWNWTTLPPHFVVDSDDAVMLQPGEQTMIAMAVPSVLAAAAGVSAWHWPEWSFFTLVGFVLSMRPIFGGRLAARIQSKDKRGPSDAEHDFIFPPNWRPSQRIATLKKAIAHPTTWLRLFYGIIWTLSLLYWGARLTDLPPWSLAFWSANGVRIAFAINGSLALLAVSYIGWELYLWSSSHATERRNNFQIWKHRWFGGTPAVIDEASRVKLLIASPVFSALQPPQRLELARELSVRKIGPWSFIPEFGDTPTQVAVIVSGKISLRRELPFGRTVHLQALAEGDIIGMHDLADPSHPNYKLRTMTPVTLLVVDRAKVEKLIEGKVPQETLTDSLLKVPFLRRIPLCANWHLQAINRFARLSSIAEYGDGETILREGRTVEEFYVIFQGEAKVSRLNRSVATVGAGNFFGEIGLLQNSAPTASVTACEGTRCMSIRRVELLRFVTHNSTVALELERVSSERLGRPIFPLKAGDFRTN